MPYTPLDIPDDLPHHFSPIINEIEKYLEEIHWLLATTIPDRGSACQLQLSTGLMLLTTVAAASSLLYCCKGKSGAHFIGFLERYYPWDIDPPQGASPREAAKTLYEAFLGPLVHHAGLNFGIGQASLGRMTLAQVHIGTDDADERIVDLERRSDRPFSEPALVLTEERRLLWLNAFYWGVRQMIERLARDSDMLNRVTDSLRDRGKPRG